jgi:hypothetical protein
MRSVAITLGILATLTAHAANDCVRPTRWEDVVSSTSAPLEPKRFSDISSQLETAEIMKRLGPAAREIGSGLFILQWDVSDGRIFSVTTGDICEKPHQVSFSMPKTSNTSLHSRK